MKRLLYFLALIAIVLARSPILVRADAAKEAHSAIQSRYDQFDRAYMKKDFTSIAEVFTPECMVKLNSEGRTMPAPRVIKGMKAVSKSLTISHAKTHILSVKATENGYEVTAVWTGYSVYIPANGSKEDPSRRAKAKQSYHDTWKKTDKGWQITGRIIEDSDDEAKPSKKK